MVSIPSFLLKRLYVKGSLKNSSGGFEFTLKNGLGSGYAHKMHPLIVDDKTVHEESTFFYLDGREVAFSDVTSENTFTLAMNRDIVIRSEGVHLDPGPHKICMSFDVPGLGTLKFDFIDKLSNPLE